MRLLWDRRSVAAGVVVGKGLTVALDRRALSAGVSAITGEISASGACEASQILVDFVRIAEQPDRTVAIRVGQRTDVYAFRRICTLEGQDSAPLNSWRAEPGFSWAKPRRSRDIDGVGATRIHSIAGVRIRRLGLRRRRVAGLVAIRTVTGSDRFDCHVTSATVGGCPAAARGGTGR